MNKAKEYKNIGHERAEYFLKERINGKGNVSFSLSCYSTDNDIFYAQRFFTKGDNRNTAVNSDVHAL